MNFSRGDLARLRTSLAAALALLALGAALVWHANRALHEAQEQRADALRQRDEYQQKLRQVREEEAEIRGKAVRFGEMRARGIVGEERRLEWVELIREIKDARRLLDLQYEFSPQQPLAGATQSGHGFRSSTMQLRMKLLHEGDLVGVIDDLRAHARAHVRVRSCTVQRIARGTTASAEAALLDADCLLDWITVLPAEAGR